MNIQTANSTSRVLVVPRTAESWKRIDRILGLVKRKVASCKTLAAAGPNAFSRADVAEYSAMVLFDWAADANGVHLLRLARQRKPQLPILVVGSENSLEARVAAFEAGADNFVSMDFDDREVLAKLGRLLASSAARRPSIEVEDLQVWPDSQIAFRNGIPVKLSSTELAILKCLALHSPQPVDRMTLLRRVFGLKFDPGTNIVEVHVHRLRRKIDTGDSERLVNTVRGQGYLLGPLNSLPAIERAPDHPT